MQLTDMDVNIESRTEIAMPISLFGEAKQLCHSLFEHLQKDISPPARFLEFGCGKGASIQLISPHINPDIFREICLYDIRDLEQTKFRRRSRDRFENVYFTTEKPKTAYFNVVHMSLVASLGISAIEEGKKALKPGGYLLLFDYNMKGASIDLMLELCRTDLEETLMNEQGIERFYRKTVQYGLEDYIEAFRKTGLEIVFEQNIPNKFCVLCGKNSNKF